METKREIRKRILSKRDLMTEEQIMDKSQAIFDRLCLLPQYKRAKIVMAYMSYRNEVSTLNFLERAVKDGKRILLPRVERIREEIENASKAMPKNSLAVKLQNVKEVKLKNATGTKTAITIKTDPDTSEKVLHIYEIHDIEKDLEPGFKGILEPIGNPADRIEPVEIDLAVIPGVVFDLQKRRIGYGGGFYDKFMPLLRQDCCKAGVAFHMQLVNEIPWENFDVPVDLVITENVII